MDKINLCKKIKKSIRHILLTDDKTIVSVGTGVVIRGDGVLLTANHVIENYDSLSKPKIITNAASGAEGVSQVGYKPFLSNVSLNISSKFAKLLKLDLAILESIKPIKTDCFIELEDEIALEGTDVLMAGFPDEIKPPMNFDKMLNFDNSNLAQHRVAIESFFKYYMRLAMIKSGMIGSTQKVNINNTKVEIVGLKQKTVNVKGATYWVDNGCTYGASGGLVVNLEGKLIGIICEKGLTYHDLYSEVPSGSTMALSHKLITWALNR